MIKLIVNDVELDLKSDTLVALTKKAVDIGNLQNRWSSYTNKFTVPATKKNRDALGLKQFQDASGAQYDYQNGKLVSGGLEIASNVLVIIESVSKDITLTLRAGNGSLFDQLNRTKLSDLDWDDLNHTWSNGIININRNRDYTHGYVYPLHQTGAQSNTKKTILGRGMIPFLYVKKAFEKIADYFGYTWTGNTYSLDMFEKLSYPIANNEIPASVANQYIFDSNFDYFDLGTGITLNWDKYPARLTVVSDPKSRSQSWNILTPGSVLVPAEGYAIPFKGIYTVEFNYNVTYRDFGSASFTKIGFDISVWDIIANSSKLYKEVIFPPSTGTNQTVSGTITFELNFITDFDIPYRYAILPITKAAGLAQYTINSGYFKITKIEANKTTFLSDWNIKTTQPDITCGKFIKEVGNVFGAIYDVDEFKKTIEITRLDEIAQNKAYAVDWSDKLDIGEQIVTTYKLDGLAKLTKLQWNEDLKYAKILTISNDQLPESAEYIKSEVDYSDNANILLYPDNVISIPYWDGSKIEPDGKLRFALIKSETSTTVNYPSAIANNTNPTNTYKVAYFDYTSSPYSLDWSKLYDYYYDDLLDPMTDRLQVVECFMKLNDLDIQSFRFKYPVYIKHFNRYFFVNEIAEYTGKTQSTKVVLVGI